MAINFHCLYVSVKTNFSFYTQKKEIQNFEAETAFDQGISHKREKEKLVIKTSSSPRKE